MCDDFRFNLSGLAWAAGCAGRICSLALRCVCLAQNATPEGTGPFRRLAPGVERTIAPQIQKEETATWLQRLDELARLAADEQVPELGKRPWAANMLENVRVSHDIWCLEFSFKPVRFVSVDVPTASGKVERKQVWYLVYRVRNTGEKPVRFVPQFVLHSSDTDMYYPDRIIATAMEPIRLREDPKRRLLNTVQISEVEIPPSAEGEDGSVWGVALWRDVDPATDRFSIYHQGPDQRLSHQDERGRLMAGLCPQDAAVELLASGRRVLRA